MHNYLRNSFSHIFRQDLLMGRMAKEMSWKVWALALAWNLWHVPAATGIIFPNEFFF